VSERQLLLSIFDGSKPKAASPNSRKQEDEEAAAAVAVAAAEAEDEEAAAGDDDDMDQDNEDGKITTPTPRIQAPLSNMFQPRKSHLLIFVLLLLTLLIDPRYIDSQLFSPPLRHLGSFIQDQSWLLPSTATEAQCELQLAPSRSRSQTIASRRRGWALALPADLTGSVEK
jgi:hypothetical protein